MTTQKKDQISSTNNSTKKWARHSHASGSLEIVSHKNPNEVWADGIPFIEMPDYVLAEPTRKWRIVDGNFVDDDPVKSLEIAKTKTIESNIRVLELELAQATKDYSSVEVGSWEIQTKEAEGFTLNPDYPTPLIDTLCEITGSAKSELISKVIAKSTKFKILLGQLIGTNKLLTNRIKTASAEDLKDIPPLGMELQRIKEEGQAIIPIQESSEDAELEKIVKSKVKAKSSKKA